MPIKVQIEDILFNQAISNSLNNTYRIGIKYIEKIYANLNLYHAKNRKI